MGAEPVGSGVAVASSGAQAAAAITKRSLLFITMFSDLTVFESAQPFHEGSRDQHEPWPVRYAIIVK